MRFRRFSVLFVVLVLLAVPARAQTADTTVVSLLRGTDLGVGALLQTDVNAGPSVANDGFDLRVARLRLKGAAAPVQFFVQTDFTDTPSLLDARVRVPITARASVAAGLYKAPFSRELLTFRGDLLMAERSRVVRALAPARQIGAHVAFDLVPDRLALDAGVYNGPRGLSANDNDQFLYVARLSGSVPTETGTLDVGANLGVSEDARVDVPLTMQNFDGTRVLLGADAEYRVGRWLASGELLSACLDPDRVNRETRCPIGLHLTGGVTLAEQHEFRLRFDHFDPDRPGPGAPDDRWTVGYAFLASASVEGRVNYTAPGSDLTDGLLKLRLQVALN